MDICLRNMDQYELEHSVVLVQGRLGLGHLLPPSPGIHRWGSIARVSSVKRGPIVEGWKLLTVNAWGR